MGEVITEFRVVPNDVNIDIEELKEKLKEKLSIYKITNLRDEPFVFGLRAIYITLLLEEREGLTDELTEKMKEVEGVESVEITRFSRAL